MKNLTKTLMAVALMALLSTPHAIAGSDGFKLPDYDQLTLDNGLTVMLMEQHEVPMIDVAILTVGGAMADGDQPGLAKMTADALRFGTRKLSKAELDQQIDFIGANLSTRAGKEYNSLSASFTVNDQDLMLELVRDVLLDPRFDVDEFDKYKTRYQTQLLQQRERPQGVIGGYFDRLIFGDHPYGVAPGGTSASVAAITVDDLRDYHQRIYIPANTVLAVAGDFKTKDMRKQLKKLFGHWSGGPSTLPKLDTPPTPNKARVLLVNKDDARETTFYIGGPGIADNNPDKVAVNVIRTILGGRFTSWLNDELRVNAGLTYGARASFVTRRTGGAFRITTFTPTETTVEAVDLALKTYNRLWDQGVDEITLESAKAYVKGQFPPGFETSGQLARLMTQMHFYGFDESFINDFQKKVDQLTVEKAAQIIDQYFPRENLQFVMVGKAETIRDLVAKYGEVTEVDINQDGFDF